jgi:small neutral amino acid transporter SnatA (MarC family)
MQIQADVLTDVLPPRVPPRVKAVARKIVARAFVATVAAVVVLWWLQVFGLWVGALQWAAGLGVSNS